MARRYHLTCLSGRHSFARTTGTPSLTTILQYFHHGVGGLQRWHGVMVMAAWTVEGTVSRKGFTGLP